MRGPPLDEVTFQEKAATVRASPDWGITEEALVAPELWHVMVDLVYSGNFDQAERFMDAAWKPGWPTRAVFWDRFRCNLQHGRFWPGIAALNGFDDPMLMPEDCETGNIEQG